MPYDELDNNISQTEANASYCPSLVEAQYYQLVLPPTSDNERVGQKATASPALPHTYQQTKVFKHK